MSTEYSYSHPPASYSHPPPAQLCVVLLILFAFITFPYWYVNYESPFEGLYDQIKFLLIISPLILLLVVHLVSRFESPGRRPTCRFRRENRFTGPVEFLGALGLCLLWSSG
ncbi:hypothetical protein C3L33_08228, partial [Rhododendron williamsianum]